ncbi:MAG: hypothetical protein ACTSWW_06235 [Promethearchaeota archaeon]
MASEWLYTVLFNLFPLILFAFPMVILRIRKSTLSKIYTRFYWGFVFFFVVYWILPSIYQQPTLIEVPADIALDTWSGFKFFFLRSFSLFTLYLQFPFILLPFVFMIGPFFSVLLVFFRLRKEPEPKGIRAKFEKLSYDFQQSPRELIREALTARDWKKEKEMFKAFLILLPISLYLLTVILDITDTPAVQINESETALGWFIEILFVYLATFLLGYQLIKSSKITLDSRFIGDDIQKKFFGSLTQIGTPIAILSTILFIVQSNESILLILYFFGYIVMAAYIFVITYRIFEPFSVLLFLKLLTLIKPRTQYPAPRKIERTTDGTPSEKKPQSSENSSFSMPTPSTLPIHTPRTQAQWLNNVTALAYGAAATFLSFLAVLGSSYIANLLEMKVENGELYENLSKLDNIPSFDIIELTDSMIIINSLTLIAITLILSFCLMFILRGIPQRFGGFWIYTGFLLGITILFMFLEGSAMAFPLNMTTDTAWISGALIEIELVGKSFLTMRTAFFTADFGVPLLSILAQPYIYLRSIVNFSFWALVFFYMRRSFHIRKIPLPDADLVELITYTDINWSLKGVQIPSNFIVTGIKPLSELILPDELHPLYTTIHTARGITLPNLEHLHQEDLPKFKSQLRGLMLRRVIKWWMPEFSHKFEPATLDGLYILRSDGLDLFYYNFRKDQQVFLHPALISGMFSAITSFIQEATQSVDNLKTIDCGDRLVILEYSDSHPIFAALFTDNQNKDIRQALKDVLGEFDARHGKVLKDWNGDVTIFSQNDDLVQKFFGDYL